MEKLKKIGIFFALFLAVIGAGCSLGWLGYHHEWVAFFGEVVVILFAVPSWLKTLRKLIG